VWGLVRQGRLYQFARRVSQLVGVRLRLEIDRVLGFGDFALGTDQQNKQGPRMLYKNPAVDFCTDYSQSED
jgi:hypothetical protein